jgi:hypothetical protein
VPGGNQATAASSPVVHRSMIIAVLPGISLISLSSANRAAIESNPCYSYSFYGYSIEHFGARMPSQCKNLS